MFGITHSGCFVLGTVLGFIGAAAVGAAAYFYFHPDEKDANVVHVEQAWKKVKDSGDEAITTIKNIKSPDPRKIYQKITPKEPVVPVPKKGK